MARKLFIVLKFFIHLRFFLVRIQREKLGLFLGQVLVLCAIEMPLKVGFFRYREKKTCFNVLFLLD